MVFHLSTQAGEKYPTVHQIYVICSYSLFGGMGTARASWAIVQCDGSIRWTYVYASLCGMKHEISHYHQSMERTGDF